MTTLSVVPVSTSQGQSLLGPSTQGPEQMRERVKVRVPLFERIANAEVSVG